MCEYLFYFIFVGWGSGSGRGTGDREFAATEGEEAVQDVHQVGPGVWAHILHQNRGFHSCRSQHYRGCQGGIYLCYFIVR